MTKTLVGKLEFISFFHPIKIDDLDIREHLWKFFYDLNGVQASMKQTMNSIEIYSDVKSEYKVKFEKDNENKSLLILLSKEPKFGFSNLCAYIPDMLKRLNGMQVIVNITKDSIKFENDPEEKVYELKYTRNNSCEIPDDKVKEICKIGEKDCCIFCTVDADGFLCEKFSSLGENLLHKYAEGTMRATRIGNCKIVGRTENSFS